ncbi:hypothetical protein GCM10023174_12690 [Chelativorans composti]|jgi:hypothetical protein|uniref:DUF883 domain-containing protein n=1 Tax=Chelativorans composti TaxID=768533 RepID=A0ABW5DDY6_9HYPH
MDNRYDTTLGETLQDQIAQLSSEVASLQKKLRRHGRTALGEARELSGEASEWIREQALPEIQRGARHLHRTARNNPGATVGVAAGLLFLGAALAFLMRR